VTIRPASGASADHDPQAPAPPALLTRDDAGWCLLIAGIYAIFTLLAAWYYHLAPDRLMVLAEQVLRGRLDSPTFENTVDTVAIGGRFYLAVGPLQPLAYLPFAFVPALAGAAGYLIGAGLGIATAWLSLPLVRSWGGGPGTDRWLATFVALGSLLLYVSVFGDIYYLAQVTSFLALTGFLIEWAGRRRPVVLGILLGLSFLARATTLLAAIPFGLALLERGRLAVAGTALERTARLLRATTGRVLAFGIPLVVALAAYGAYNWARFGSATETGYGISLLTDPALDARRSIGVFSIQHVAENLRLALLAGFDVTGAFPFLVANPYGLSMLLVSPALLTSVRAGFAPATRVLWAAAAIVALPVFLYYGGGFVQYGFRYSLDFTPFLVALMAAGSRRGFGRLDRTLIVFSIASVTYGVVWHIRGGVGP
jgi:hypothetical protein